MKNSISKVLLFSVFSVSMTFAAADSLSIEERQKTLLEKLTDLEANALGFALNGYVKGGYLRSSIDSDLLSDDSQTAEAQAYTRMGLVFSARPSSETVARVDLRMHKDWQSAHREGNNVPIINWWSYDGSILNKHVRFNMGNMRVAYTPLTMFQSQTDYLMEPEVFATRRLDVMEERNLDGSNARLMQGLNFEIHSLELGFLNDFFIQGTFARLRNNAKKGDQLFFDFDDSDRYLFAGRLGAEFAGVYVGVNEVYVFDRVRSSRTVVLNDRYPLYYEDNNVLSFEVGFDSKRLSSAKKKLEFGARGEVALSHWTSSVDQLVVDTIKVMAVYTDSTVMPDGSKELKAYLDYKDSIAETPSMTRLAELKNKLAVHVDAYAELNLGSIEAKAVGNFVMVDKGYQSELAMTPITLGNISVLNSEALFTSTGSSSMDVLLSMVRSGSLENLYFSFYESVPLNETNMIVNTTTGTVMYDDAWLNKYYVKSDSFSLFNNYKYGHFIRNGYNYETLKRLELREASLSLDPSSDIALPFGYSTPNRTGGDIDINVSWRDAVALRAVFGFYKADELFGEDTLHFVSGTEYLRLGGGISVDVARLVGFNRDLEVNGSFVLTQESGFLEREAIRSMVGLKVGIYGQLSFLGGFQYLEHKFGKPYFILNSVSESLLLVGPKIELAKGAEFSVQYGLMTNSIDYLNDTGSSSSFDITKNILMADITVRF